MVWISAAGVVLVGLLALIGLVQLLSLVDRRQPGDLHSTTPEPVVPYSAPRPPRDGRRVVTLNRDVDGVYRRAG